MRRAQTETHQCALVLPVARALEDFDQPLDPFVILRRGQIDQIAQRRRRMHERRIVAAMRDELRQECVQETTHGRGRRLILPRPSEIDRGCAAALSKQPVISLAQQFRHASGRRSQHDQAARLMRGQRQIGQRAQIVAAADEVFGRESPQDSPKAATGLRCVCGHHASGCCSALVGWALASTRFLP